MRTKGWVFGLFGCAVVTACASISGLDDFEMAPAEAPPAGEGGKDAGSGGSGGSTSTSGGAGAGGEGGDAVCGVGNECVEVPAGAIAVLLSDGTCPYDTTPMNVLDCTMCSCASQSPICTISGTIYDTPDCTGDLLDFAGDSSDGCIDIPDQTNTAYMRATAGTNCPPVEPSPLTLCAIAPGPCPPGSLCAQADACILMDVGYACPPARATAINVYEGGNCGCSCAPTADCSPKVRLYDYSNCSVSGYVADAYGACETINLPGALRAVRAPAPPPGSLCEPTPNPSGGSEKTLCCP